MTVDRVPLRPARRRTGGAILRGVALIGLSIGATPGSTAIPRQPARVVPARPGAAAITAALERARAGDCKGVLALLDPLVRGPVTAGDGARFSAQLLRLPCLAPQGRQAEIAPVITELKAIAPQHPMVLGFELFGDVDAGRTVQAADKLVALAATGSRALALVPGALWRVLAQRLTEMGEIQRRDATALALARAGWAPRDIPDLGQGVTIDAINALLADRQTDEARALLDRLSWPGALWDMAIQRRYAVLWPDIEKRMGPQGGTAADRYARTALEAYAGHPDDDRARRDAVRAFIVLGRPADVIAIAEPVAIAPGMNEDQVETVLGHAQALAAIGNRAAAIARMQPFATLDLSRAPPAAAATISLVEALHEADRDPEALTLARSALNAKAAFFSPFGRAWLRRSEVCALSAARADATTAIAELGAHAGDNQAAAVEGLLCAGRDDDAAKLAIATLATTEGASRLADQFQPGEALFLRPQSKLRAMWTRLLARPDVRRAFEASARLLPPGLRPAETPRAVPVLPGASRPSVTTT